MNIVRLNEVNQWLNNPFRFAGNTLDNLAQSSHLPTRQAIADQYSAPQEDFGSLLAVLES